MSKYLSSLGKRKHYKTIPGIAISKFHGRISRPISTMKNPPKLRLGVKTIEQHLKHHLLKF